MRLKQHLQDSYWCTSWHSSGEYACLLPCSKLVVRRLRDEAVAVAAVMQDPEPPPELLLPAPTPKHNNTQALIKLMEQAGLVVEKVPRGSPPSINPVLDLSQLSGAPSAVLPAMLTTLQRSPPHRTPPASPPLIAAVGPYGPAVPSLNMSGINAGLSSTELELMEQQVLLLLDGGSC